MKKAFTLAELLIVLVIIGFIATITIMTMIKSVPDQQHLLFRKTYYEMSKAVSMVANDSFFYPGRNRTRPVLAAPVTDITRIREKFNPANDNHLNANTMFCYSMSVLVGDSQGGRFCLATPACDGNADDDAPLPNFTLSNGTKIFGLCGNFTNTNRHRVYLYTQANKADKQRNVPVSDTNIVTQYENDRPAGRDPLSWKTHLFRVWIDANGKIYADPNDPLENLLLKDEKRR